VEIGHSCFLLHRKTEVKRRFLRRNRKWEECEWVSGFLFHPIMTHCLWLEPPRWRVWWLIIYLLAIFDVGRPLPFLNLLVAAMLRSIMRLSASFNRIRRKVWVKCGTMKIDNPRYGSGVQMTVQPAIRVSWLQSIQVQMREISRKPSSAIASNSRRFPIP
jgi:hypothetical protein